MPTITIDGTVVEFQPGEVILKAALRARQSIPYYCYHPGLSIVASCRICLAEVWQPNPRNNNALEPLPKLVPTCQTACAEGMVVYTDSPKAAQNQKAVMEYLLINHPLDCPVCDQAGECLLQDYSYEYGRSVSRFEEDKIKQPKKDLGPNVLLYSDRCIMCSRCVRFTREVSGTAELTVEGRGAHEQIDVFPGKALDNELASNVIDICPVGALLDKDFLFTQRVWFLKSAASIDGLTASGDNVWIEHNDGRVYRVKPRENMRVNRWWITDEVRYGWKHVHSEERLTQAMSREYGAQVPVEARRAVGDAVAGLRGKKIALVVSPMLACEEAYALGVAAAALSGDVTPIVGPVPRKGEDRVYPAGAKPAAEGGTGFAVRAEKAPNARGVRRVLEALFPGKVRSWDAEASRLGSYAGALLTGNYPSDWATPEVVRGLGTAGGGGAPFVVLLDTLRSALSERADVLLPGATWVEKDGTFESAAGLLQTFERAIAPIDGAAAEGQTALDVLAEAEGSPRRAYDAARLRHEMGRRGGGLSAFGESAGVIQAPEQREARASDMAVVEL